MYGYMYVGQNNYALLYFGLIFLYIFTFMFYCRYIPMRCRIFTGRQWWFRFSLSRLRVSGNWVRVSCVKLPVLDNWHSIMSVGDLGLAITLQLVEILRAHLYESFILCLYLPRSTRSKSSCFLQAQTCSQAAKQKPCKHWFTSLQIFFLN